MRAPLALATFLVVGFPVAGSADDKPTNPAGDLALYPLKKGAKWEWQDEKQKRTEEVVDIKNVKDMPCYELKVTIATPDGPESLLGQPTYRTSFSYTWLAVKDDGVYDVGHTDELRVKTTYNVPPICKLRLPGSGATSWKAEYRYEDPDLKYQVTTLSRLSYFQTPDKVTVGGKTYDAVRVTQASDATNLRIWYVPGRGPVKQDVEILFGSSRGKVYESPVVSVSGVGGVTVGDVVLNSGFTERDASGEEVDALPGVVTEVEKTRTITREVSLSTKNLLEGEAGGGAGFDIKAVRVELSGKIKKAIETEAKEVLTDTETRRQKVTIDGNKIPKARVVWVDLYKTGTVEVTKDGKVVKVPFEFPYGTKLVVRPR